jgi:ribose transport system permease protein
VAAITFAPKPALTCTNALRTENGPPGFGRGTLANVTLDTSSIQFYVSRTNTSSREEIEVAPTQQVIKVDEPVDRLAEPETPTIRIEVGRVLGKLAPRRISAIYLLGFFIVLFGALSPDTFLTEVTFRLVFRSGVVTCILALAFLVPLTAGVYDLSIGAVMALGLGIVVYLSLHTDLPILVTALIAIAASALSGAVSGFIVVKLHVDSFIATLGVSQVLAGVLLLMSNNTQLIGQFPEGWGELGRRDILGVPSVVWMLLLLALVMWYALEFTAVGRHLLATGGNREAARLAGVPTERVLFGVFVASGAISGLAGVVFSMQSPVFSSSVGPGYLFPAVAAVFLGASQLSQRPNVWGTLIAYFALAFGIQGLALSAASASVWSQPMFQGVSLIIAVAVASRPVLRKLRASRAKAPESVS